MNKCYFIGKVVSTPIFDFLYDSKYISICHFSLELNDKDKNVIKIYAVNELADYIYQKVDINKYICIEGILCSNIEDFSVQIINVELLKKWNDLS